MALGRSPDVAINHDPIALAMHEANHPNTGISLEHPQRPLRDRAGRQALRFAWFSPDCTHHSKARGGKPFRDPRRARRIRGLAWEVVRCAVAIRPRLIFMENVEEWRTGAHSARTDFPTRRRRAPASDAGSSAWRTWALAYVIEWRELLACDYGAPTRRKRLFVIARCDGLPIVWPEPTHGPARAALSHRGGVHRLHAAGAVDLPHAEGSEGLGPGAWRGRAEATTGDRDEAPDRARVQRFVLESPAPFILRFNTERGEAHQPRGQHIDAPLSTLDTSNRFALIAPVSRVSAAARGRARDVRRSTVPHDHREGGYGVSCDPARASPLNSERATIATPPRTTIRTLQRQTGGHFALVAYAGQHAEW
jgi:DNA (cytosine-5)-methyltransferase 1